MTFRLSRAVCTIVIVALSLASPLAFSATSVTTDFYNPVNTGATSAYPTISSDGRYIAYRHNTNSGSDIYLYDRVAGSTGQINLTPDGLPGGSTAINPVISADGRYILFLSRSPQMGLPANSGGYFVYDRINRSTEKVMSGTTAQINPQMYAGISADGHYVVYRTPGPQAGTQTIYVRDMVAKTTQATTAANPYPGGAVTAPIRISDDGRYITYFGKANANTSVVDLLLHDRSNGTTEMLNVNSSGVRESWANGPTQFGANADASVFVFTTISNNLSANDFANNADVFIRDRKAGTTEQISKGTTNLYASGGSGLSISADGRFVTFFGYNTAINSQQTMYRYDRSTKTYRSALNNFTQSAPFMSADGRYVVYDYVGAQTTLLLIAITDYGAGSGLTLSTKALALTEGGIAGTYTAVLNQEPTANVTVSVKPDAQLSVASPQLTFTAANWNMPQTISVQAIDDAIVEGPHSGAVLHTVSSTDLAYTVVAAKTVTVAITDAIVPTIVAQATWAQTDLPVTGTAAPGATVLLTVVNRGTGVLSSVSAVADAQGHWSYTLTGLIDGIYDLDAQADGIKSVVKTVTVALPPKFVDVTGSITTTAYGLIFNRSTGKYAGNFILTNSGSAALAGPLQLEFDSLTTGVTLFNASGSHAGAPYITVPAGLAVGESVTIALLFDNPAKGAIDYTARIVSGTF